MKTLKQSLSNQDYCYYGYGAASIDFNSFTNEDCVKFIDKYFKAGGKGKVIAEIEKAFSEHPERASHSVSAYMIGLMAYQSFKEYIDEQLKDATIKEFSHIWFLICLYHDYGYFLEDSTKPVNCIHKNHVFKALKSIDLKHWGSRYDPELIKAYFRHRDYKEHGIIAGGFLHRRMNANLNEAIKQNPHLNPNDFVWLDLHWSEGHREWYDFAASIIIKHNIWFANTDTDASDQDDRCKEDNRKSLESYTQNPQLEGLIIDNNQLLTFDENPLLFLMCIIDTIEPQKIGQRINKDKKTGVTNSMILDIVNLQFSDSKLIIGIQYESGFHNILHNRIQTSAKRLETWMQVKVTNIERDNILHTIIQW